MPSAAAIVGLIAIVAAAATWRVSVQVGVVAAPRAAAALYRDLCSACHGTEMQGGQGPDLTRASALSADDALLASSIREVHSHAALTGKLSDAELRTLVILIREQRAKRQPAGPAWTLTPNPDMLVKSRLHAFRLQTFVDGVEEPWSVAFLPDGRVLVAEKPGRLRIVDGGRLLADPVAGIPDVWSRGQGGLLDVAVHPRYAENGWIYLSYSEPGSKDLSMTAVSRGRLRDGQWVDQLSFFKFPLDRHRFSSIHFGSRIVFDREGYLFFSVGDRGFANDAQDLTRPNGKVHRLKDDGTVPFDNPIIGVVDGLRTIWCFGNRNPQGLAVDPATGDLWEVEQGPRGGDELNRIQPGRNYGWPLVSNGMNYDGTAISADTSREGLEPPVFQWTPSITVSSMDFYSGRAFPRWTNQLFVSSLTFQDVRRLRIDNGRVVEEEILFKNQGRVRDIVNGPDGFLYVVLNSPDRIARIVPASASESKR